VRGLTTALQIKLGPPNPRRRAAYATNFEKQGNEVRTNSSWKYGYDCARSGAGIGDGESRPTADLSLSDLASAPGDPGQRTLARQSARGPCPPISSSTPQRFRPSGAKARRARHRLDSVESAGCLLVTQLRQFVVDAETHPSQPQCQTSRRFNSGSWRSCLLRRSDGREPATMEEDPWTSTGAILFQGGERNSLWVA